MPAYQDRSTGVSGCARAKLEIEDMDGKCKLTVIHDDLAAGNLAPGRHYTDSGYLSAALVVSELARHGIAPQRARLIPGSALDVLPRLTDGHYDLVFCDGDKAEYGAYLKEAMRLLRPGGVVAFDNALWHDRVADPAQRDEDTVSIRDLGRTIAEAVEVARKLTPQDLERRCHRALADKRRYIRLRRATEEIITIRPCPRRAISSGRDVLEMRVDPPVVPERIDDAR